MFGKGFVMLYNRCKNVDIFYDNQNMCIQRGEEAILLRSSNLLSLSSSRYTTTTPIVRVGRRQAVFIGVAFKKPLFLFYGPSNFFLSLNRSHDGTT